jgi:hypothetical protein
MSNKLTKLVNGQTVEMAEEETAEFMAQSEAAMEEILTVERSSAQLSFSQFIVGLSEQGWINQTEANNWLSANSLPAAVEAAIAKLPETAPDGSNPRLRARARALRPSVILRTNELLLMMAAMRGATAAQLDDFFRVYATI